MTNLLCTGVWSPRGGLLGCGILAGVVGSKILVSVRGEDCHEQLMGGVVVVGLLCSLGSDSCAVGEVGGAGGGPVSRDGWTRELFNQSCPSSADTGHSVGLTRHVRSCRIAWGGCRIDSAQSRCHPCRDHGVSEHALTTLHDPSQLAPGGHALGGPSSLSMMGAGCSCPPRLESYPGPVFRTEAWRGWLW
jgi:hypothetical protein